jgi:protocatechuate 3,4-dioxygenase beta subunit
MIFKSTVAANPASQEEQAMENHRNTKRTRREFLRLCLAMPVTFVLAACADQAAVSVTPPPASAPPTSAPPAPTQLPPTSVPPTSAPPAPTQPAPAAPPTQSAQAQVLPPTPECGDADDLTVAQTEGPYYTPNTPERASLLETGMAGTRLVVTGQVLTTSCQPVARALLDFWQADDVGVYDNTGYRLRGHQFADDQGRYTLETVVPGLYPGRTRHIHVKVQAPNQPVLTTQLYFPNEAGNNRDGIFNSALVMDVQDDAAGKVGAFNFVLDIA